MMMNREKMIKNYIDGYNQFDINKMVADFDDNVIFENTQNGETNVFLTGLSAFKQQAEHARLQKDKQNLLDNITDELKRINGVKAIGLGGSYDMEMATDSSDLDLGIYYFEQHPYNLEKVKLLAEKYAESEKPTVTGFYDWCP